MHELGIAFTILKQVKEVAIENKATHIAKVTLQIGEVTGVVPSYLKDVWKWACSKEELTKGCKLETEVVTALTYCEDCKELYPTVQYGKTCPHCGSEHTYLHSGSEVTIKEIGVY